uniref:SAM domain-containing protein n=1 Tax=Ditylenchus dipsaci TaxID=166011 RepID=A0A915DCA8_9BILA
MLRINSFNWGGCNQSPIFGWTSSFDFLKLHLRLIKVSYAKREQHGRALLLFCIIPGIVEERVQVDRKALETMISEKSEYASSSDSSKANELFEKVEKILGVEKVCWPTKLKIGAKTKKDPFVKIFGTEDGVRLAKAMIVANFKSNKDRITLKMEINHSEHSFIIGRGGKNTRQIMQDTTCHIHFPDCNKKDESIRNDQVSIAGSIAQVEKARAKLRLTSPIIMLLSIPRGCIRSSLDISSMLQHPFSLTNRLEIIDVSIHLSYNPLSNSLEILFKSCSEHESNLVDAVARMCSLLGVYPNETACHLNFNLRPELLHLDYGLLSQNTISWIAVRTNTQIHFTQQQGFAATFLSIVGSPRGLLMSRRFLIGLLPVVLQFKHTGSENDFKSFCLKTMENELEIRINEKCKILSSQQNTVEKRAYIARNQILQLSEADVPSPEEYSCINNLILINQHIIKPPPYIERPQTLKSYSENTDKCETIYSKDAQIPAIPSHAAPNSPDPNESPIAASLLASAKNINTEKGDFWKAPGVERQFGLNRDKMLLKASKAIYTIKPETTNTEDRQPTDFWSGYGFSNSLPAEILKIGLSKNIWAIDDQDIANANSTNCKQPSLVQKQEPKLAKSRPIIGRSFSDFDRNRSHSEREISLSSSSPMNAPLASVKEEDEFHDVISVKFQPTKKTTFLFDKDYENNFTSNEPLKKHNFAASTSFFEPSTTFPGDIVWDIRVFHDPSIVLTQVGCKEYLPQFREQEIDMQAFLLLDEANLKDIGVSTIGARKKIFNAILRLRESAKKSGNVI